jgi:stage V sporulation protein SpoVS
VLPDVERNHHNPTDIDDRPGATPPLPSSVNPNSLLAAFIANLDCLSSAELEAVGQAIAATETRKAIALVKGMAASAELAAAAIAVLSGKLPRL